MASGGYGTPVEAPVEGGSGAGGAPVGAGGAPAGDGQGAGGGGTPAGGRRRGRGRRALDREGVDGGAAGTEGRALPRTAHRLGIMKTKRGRPTGEARRQRAILASLASHPRPADRTRPAIAKAVSGGGGAQWKNMYSGVFNDIEGSLVPQGLIEEEGRLPYKRGPRAVQAAGIPYYRLTRLGRLACLSLAEVTDREALIGGLVEDSESGAEKRALGAVAAIARFSPEFVDTLLGDQARAYSEGRVESLLPEGSNGGISREEGEEGRPGGGLARITIGFVDGLAGLPERDRESVMEFLRGIA